MAGRPRKQLTRAQATILALAVSRGFVRLADHPPRQISLLLTGGLIAPFPGSAQRDGKYKITPKGREMRERAARMCLIPPGTINPTTHQPTERQVT